MSQIARPQWVFDIYCFGRGDEFCAADADLQISPVRRLFWRIRGALLTRLFGWWRWM